MKTAEQQLIEIIREELEALNLTEQQIEEILPKALKKWGTRAALAGSMLGAMGPSAAHAGDTFDDWRSQESSEQAEEEGTVKVTDANGDTWKIDKESGFGTLCSDTECRAKQFSPQEIAQLTGGPAAVKEYKINKKYLIKIIKEELEAAGDIDLQALEPKIEAAYSAFMKEMQKVPEEERAIVMQAVSSKISAGAGAEPQLAEKKKYKKSFYKAKDDRADYLISKGVDPDVAYGVADKQMAKAGKKKKK